MIYGHPQRVFALSLLFLHINGVYTIAIPVTQQDTKCGNSQTLQSLKNANVLAASSFCERYLASDTTPLPAFVSRYDSEQIGGACKCLLVNNVSNEIHIPFRTPYTPPAVPQALLTSSLSSARLPEQRLAGCGSGEAKPYWLDNLKHQGLAAFNANPTSYQVYRNVKCFGAVGDGVTDDTAAINNAISSGIRCGQGCDSTTTQPALIYFPSGTYLISSPIIAFSYSQLVGNANNWPIIKGAANFAGIALIDSDPYVSGNNWYTNQNNFFREVRNFVVDTTNMGPDSGTGIHWQVAQASSLQNIRFESSRVAGNKHQGLFMDNGSGGFMSDLTFNGGRYGAFLGNQQFTSRNLVFNNQQLAAIFTNWDWAWTFKSVIINNTPVGIDISNGGPASQSVSSIVLLDSSFTNVGVAVKTARDASSDLPVGSGALIIENLAIQNVPVVVAAVDGSTSKTILAGTGASTVIANFGQGRQYTPTTPGGAFFQQAYSPARARAQIMSSGNKIVEKSKPNYETLSASNFISARSMGAKGDGRSDDTTALQAALDASASQNKVLFLDHGVYLVTSTLSVKPGVRLVGEAWPRIMSSGNYFNQMKHPRPVIQVGTAGQVGLVELQNLVLQTQGPAAGAIMVEWNLQSTSMTNPSGMWDVHTNIGGSAGTHLQSDTCRWSSAPQTTPNTACIGAFMLVHVTKSAAGVYMENNWFWTSDHDLDAADHDRVTIYVGRGMLVESTNGPLWLYGTAVEHNVLYNYQFSNTANAFAGMIQTETPYYQSNPVAPAPFTYNSLFSDPDFATICARSPNPALCKKAYGLRIVNSDNISIYGSGLYSFFENYSQDCLKTTNCQLDMISVENEKASNKYVVLYNVNTIGSTTMVEEDGVNIAEGSDNVSTFPNTFAYYYTI